jgi:hypothetical protein
MVPIKSKDSIDNSKRVLELSVGRENLSQNDRKPFDVIADLNSDSQRKKATFPEKDDLFTCGAPAYDTR